MRKVTGFIRYGIVAMAIFLGQATFQAERVSACEEEEVIVTPEPVTEIPTPEPVTEIPTPEPVTETPTSEPVTETPTSEPVTETPSPILTSEPVAVRPQPTIMLPNPILVIPEAKSEEVAEVTPTEAPIVLIEVAKDDIPEALPQTGTLPSALFYLVGTGAVVAGRIVKKDKKHNS